MSEIAALIDKLITETRARHPERPALIGVGGAQGSGKSYVCRAYANAHAGVAHFSLDDVYLTKAEREARAERHADDPPPFPPGREPVLRDAATHAQLKQLFVTRGPPGTHDLGLAKGLTARLRRALPTPLPRFDKSKDDRAPEDAWPVFEGPASTILVDGWCLGAKPPPPSAPMNAVEQEDVLDIEFSDQSWRWQSAIQYDLANEYAIFFAAFDCIIYLQAPSWEIVRVWRGEQEEETLGRPLTAEENAALDRFVMHYERVTRDMLAGHHGAHWIVRLDRARNVIGIEER
ncbi:MAG: kinase [Terricaulis sp.]|nr:kinase [Terricaulis sp.]